MQPSKSAMYTRNLRASSGWLLAATLLLSGGCRATQKDAPGAPQGSGGRAEQQTLPPLVINDQTADLLITWLDKSGDFHVVQKPAEVPEEGRARVRVVVTTLEAGTADVVYVANLTTKNTDGTYPVESMSRAEWNNLGADLRKVRLETMAPQTQQVPTPPVEGSEGKQAQAADFSKVRVIIYGASWCKPCHDAEKFLRSLGADVTKKDIEESRSAQAEMQQKLAQAGRMGSSIPVIDVAGTLLVGFSEDALRKAVKAAARAETL